MDWNSKMHMGERKTSRDDFKEEQEGRRKGSTRQDQEKENKDGVKLEQEKKDQTRATKESPEDLHRWKQHDRTATRKTGAQRKVKWGFLYSQHTHNSSLDGLQVRLCKAKLQNFQ